MSTSSMTQSTAHILRTYLREVKSTPSEIGKRERFGALLGSLFPNAREVGIYTQGSERALKIQLLDSKKTGRVDTFYGSAVVEFEKNLKQTLAEAERQLKEYVAGVWQTNEMERRGLDAVATDGVRWRIYRPVLPEGAKLIPENIELELRREIELKEETHSDFYRWLNNFLFRQQHLDPTTEAIQEDFGSTSHLFLDGLATLRRAWALARRQTEARLAFENWQQYLTVTYGKLSESDRSEKDKETGANVSELEELFLRHTYLVSVAKLMVWAALSQGKTNDSLRTVAKNVFSGEFFESKRLGNMAESDFFHWTAEIDAEDALAPIWERILDALLTFDLSQIKEDVLKGVYQQLIDPKDRHDLGEYYTPDWLCERVVAETLPSIGYKTVLDPSCGSGSFLRASIRHYILTNTGGTDHDRLREILANVKGIDIHPVAVTFARATYVLALGKLVNSARRPIQIPVYLADSLFLPREVEKDLYDKLSGIEITFGPRKMRRSFVLPDMLVNQPESFDEAIAACAVIASDHATSAAETRQGLEKYLHQAVPSLNNMLQRTEIIDALWSFVESLAELIRQKQNSIWSFVIRNSYRPAMLREQFDIIVGNPPWVAYRFVSDLDYQAEIKLRAVNQYKIAPKHQRLFTQMELATVFLAHSLSTFSRKGGKLAFVMPRSVLNADQHQNLIARRYSAKFKLTGYWDLRHVKPLFNVPSCVLFAEQSLRSGSTSDVLPVIEWQGNLSGRDLPWSKASLQLTEHVKKGRVIWLGNRCALSTGPGSKQPTKASKYAEVFRQGATVVPRNLFFVKVTDCPVPPVIDQTYWAVTDEEQALDSKKPYKDVRISGSVEGCFIFSTALSRHLVPFNLLNPIHVVLPLVDRSGELDLLTAKELNAKGYRGCGKWMTFAEKTWNEKRGTKSGKQSIYERINYQNGLINQMMKHRHLVLYNHSGMNVSATYYDRSSAPAPFIVDVKLYWAAFSSAQEANYLACILNSDAVNDAIKPFQSMGLMGERDIHKKVLDLPIPIFDDSNKLHSILASLGVEAHKQAKAATMTDTFPVDGNLASQRSYIRRALGDIHEDIEAIVTSLLAS